MPITDDFREAEMARRKENLQNIASDCVLTCRRCGGQFQLSEIRASGHKACPRCGCTECRASTLAFTLGPEHFTKQG